MKHPSEETILAAVSGGLDRPHRIVVEAHLEQCPTCRASQGELARAGGSFLTGIPPEAPPAALWERLESAVRSAPPVDRTDPAWPLPESVRAELRGQPKPSWWSLLLNGGKVAVLLEDPATKALLCLGEMPGSRRFPRHEHLGFEQVTVLAGGYEDERGSFEAGDYAEYGPGSEHGPDTLDGDPCWTLFRLEGKVRFRGWRGLLQRLVP
ncbi:MAG: cupin domain-containing protein [Thermoanaerobaculia bacterium]